MGADALDPWIDGTTAPIILTMQARHFFVFHKVGIQQPVPIQFWEMIENANVFSCFPNEV